MYLNVVQLAESLGVEESIIEGWVRNEALPHIPDRGRLLFDRTQVAAWAASRGLAAKAGFLAAEKISSGSNREHWLESLLCNGGIWRDIASAHVIEVFERVVSNIPGAAPSVRQVLVQRLRTPGAITWAPVGGGLALPHLRSPVALGRDSGVLALLFLRDPFPLSEPVPDDKPVNRLLFFLAPSPRAHLELLGQLSAGLSRGNLRRVVTAAAPDSELFAALAALESSSRANSERNA